MRIWLYYYNLSIPSGLAEEVLYNIIRSKLDAASFVILSSYVEEDR